MTANNFGARYFSLFLQIFVFAMNGTLYACEYMDTQAGLTRRRLEIQ